MLQSPLMRHRVYHTAEVITACWKEPAFNRVPQMGSIPAPPLTSGRPLGKPYKSSELQFPDLSEAVVVMTCL